MNAPRRSWDVHAKRAVALGLPGILDLLGEVDVGGVPLMPQTVELPAGAHRADLVFMSPTGVVIHVEIQHEPDGDMPRRMVEYHARIARTAPFARTMTDIVQVIVQITGPPMPSSYRMGRLFNTPHLLHIPTMATADLLAIPGLAPFALAPGRVDLVAPVVEQITTMTDLDTRLSLITLAVQTVPDLGDVILGHLRRLDMIDVEEAFLRTEFGRGIFAQGRVEGQVEGQVAIVVDILSTRFSDFPAERIAATARRLVAEHPDHAGRAALALTTLDG